MTPQQLSEFEDMKKRLADVEAARNVSFVKELQRRLAQGVMSIQDNASAVGTTIAVRNAVNNGSETVAESYTGVVNLYQNGILIGRIGYY